MTTTSNHGATLLRQDTTTTVAVVAAGMTVPEEQQQQHHLSRTPTSPTTTTTTPAFVEATSEAASYVNENSDNKEEALLPPALATVVATEDDDDSNGTTHTAQTTDRHLQQQLMALHTARLTIRNTAYIPQRMALEAQFAAQYAPLYAQRRELVSCTNDFWRTALTHHPTVAPWITERDGPTLACLTDITCSDRIDGFTLVFSFDKRSNPTFANPTLTKTYTVPNLWLGGQEEPVLHNVTGTIIDWHTTTTTTTTTTSTSNDNENTTTPSCCLTHTVVSKTQRGKGKRAGHVRTIQQTIAVPSWFHWFAPPVVPMMATASRLTEEQVQVLEQKFEADYQMAEAIRTEIIPNAVVWFRGGSDDDDDASDDDEKGQQEGEVVFSDEENGVKGVLHGDV